MKIAIPFFALALAALASAQTNIPVRLAPSPDAPEIGQLEAMSLAVPAEWPQGEQPVEGWKPVYYQGVFEVYVDNNAIQKDLTVEPGTPYFLSPDPGAYQLSIATEKDKTDILSVDTWISHLQLETILVAYIQDQSVDAKRIVNNLPDQTPSLAKKTPASEQAVREFQGRLLKSGMLLKNRSGYAYRLVGPDGKTLAFVDLSQLPDRVQISDFVELTVKITGTLKPNENGDTLILVAQRLAKASN
ncbi:hypothetical protein [Pelagicoccus sp. SDUM812003]|uniref:hypothetical protein n=1 Tax=Pelagicoccus sp. SDUM812003 TaxID=3041267 RepID=UPI00280E1F7D|nr:hypothetical protein [Pelagicoccus sp. SDUM812003]MDQ8202986.1 hypothetical protein [Pelagicoccus sp. SDUM812003]